MGELRNDGCGESSERCERMVRVRYLRIFAALLLIGGCGGLPQPGNGSGAPVAPGEGDGALARLESEVAERVNDYRSRQGKAALRPQPYLTELAREHSRAMARGRRNFGHDGFDERAERVHEKLGAMSISENVSYNNYPIDAAAARVVNGWIGSPGHQKNLVGAFTHAGTGAARTRSGTWYVTQLYASIEP